jgi:hypothetical protein
MRALLIAAAVAATFLVATPAGAIPLPDQDPFYAVPPGVGGLANGAITKSRPVNASAYSLPLPVRAWQVQYKTLDTHDAPTADVATVLVPLLPWLGSGPRPLLSYQTAEDGVGSKCAPSYALRAGLGSLPSNSEAETGLIALALLKGWAVVAPDYEGPNSAFLGAAGEAHGVLDGVRAARAFGPAGVQASAPLALWGYSGGALASDLAAQAQPSYAPELQFVGVALGGVVSDLRATLLAFSGGPVGGALVVGFVGVNRAYPELNLPQYLNDAGRSAIVAGADDCLADAALQFPFASISQFQAHPGIVDELAPFLHGISPLGIAGTPAAPIYDYHAVLDELAPITGDRALMARYCAAGAVVQHVESPLDEHVSLALTGAPGAIAYLADRFAGRRAPSTC